MNSREVHKIWIEQCEVAQTIRARFGLKAALQGPGMITGTVSRQGNPPSGVSWWRFESLLLTPASAGSLFPPIPGDRSPIFGTGPKTSKTTSCLTWRLNKPENDDLSLIEPIEPATDGPHDKEEQARLTSLPKNASNRGGLSQRTTVRFGDLLEPRPVKRRRVAGPDHARRP